MQLHSNTEGCLENEELILACQPFVERMARRYAREWYRVDYDDFVQLGMLAICKEAPHAMQAATNPMAYLVKSAQNEMLTELARMRGENTTSLDAPLTADRDGFSLADLLPDTSLMPKPRVSSKKVQALNAALQRLNTQKRKSVSQRYGLPGYGVHNLKEMQQASQASESAVHNRDYYGRLTLRSDALLCEAMGVEVPEKEPAGVVGVQTGASARIRELLAENPALSPLELARMVGCTRRNASYVRKQFLQSRLVEVAQ